MTDSTDQNTKGQGGLTRAALFGLCPRCGARTLWDAPAGFAPACRGCGLPFAEYEPRGRGLYFVLLPLIALMIAAALRLDDLLHPPLWLILGLIVAVVPAVIIGAIRLMKAVFLLARLRAAGVVA
ncbi:DUF983 domain-containing protein [Novosphingobium sp. AAP93]|uniref:DUF983 domain-containing protein n=1 Tax=Novosphingobium sp. AAP93 TaxID=1523427 RepID=UPI0006B8A95F|nr:DUF983 domain-containing protein [Novosphingobium sp. AAP93]KPF89833.1 hypothetical protein IP83_00615 [Novosphingobium sp. AAP93]